MRNNDFIGRSIIGVLLFLQESVFADAYALKKGLFQALDARVKIISVGLLLLTVMFSKSLLVLSGLYLFCLLLALVSRIPFWFFLKRTWFFIPIFSLFIAIPALFDLVTPGEPLLSFKIFWFSLTISRQGVFSVLLFLTRVLVSVSFTVLLALATTHYSLLAALRFFKVPQIFVMTLGMCYRYIYFFIGIIMDTYNAIKSRVGRLNSLKKGQDIVAWSIASLWHRSYLMHEQVYSAMISRGFEGEPKLMNEFKTKKLDWLWLCVVIAPIVIYRILK